jgi:hypothetical protein
VRTGDDRAFKSLLDRGFQARCGESRGGVAPCCPAMMTRAHSFQPLLSKASRCRLPFWHAGSRRAAAWLHLHATEPDQYPRPCEHRLQLHVCPATPRCTLRRRARVDTGHRVPARSVRSRRCDLPFQRCRAHDGAACAWEHRRRAHQHPQRHPLLPHGCVGVRVVVVMGIDGCVWVVMGADASLVQ